MHQLLKYGKFLDNIQRTNNDKNDYRIEGNKAIFNLYNQKNIKIGEFIIDAEDIYKVRNHKWRKSHNHVVTGNKWKGENRVKDLAWIVLGLQDLEGKVVDHINHNPLDNRKNNLRVCEQNKNTKNVSKKKNNKSGYVGVSFNKSRNKWSAEIKVNYRKIHLGEYKNLEDAVYARMIAEALYFGDYKNEEEYENKYQYTNELPVKTRQQICQKITEKYMQYC